MDINKLKLDKLEPIQIDEQLNISRIKTDPGFRDLSDGIYKKLQELLKNPSSAGISCCIEGCCVSWCCVRII